MFGLVLSLLLAGAPACTGCTGPEVRVRDRTELLTAIKDAKGGERLVLAPGDYGLIEINNRVFEKPLSLASADPQRPAALSGLHMYKTRNVDVRGLSLGRGLAAGERHWTQLNAVSNCQNISFENVFVHGSIDGNPTNDGWGLYIVESDNVSIANSRFEELGRAFLFDNSKNIKVLTNVFFHIQSDAGDFTSVENVLIDGNRYSDFLPGEGDHPEAIQFWTNGQTRGSANITISNNVLLQGNGVGPQGIFVRDELKKYPYRNVRILNNLIYTNDQWEGISVEGAEELEVAGNTVVSQMNNDKTVWIRLERIGQGVVRDNVAVRYVASDDVKVTLKDNVFFDRNPGAARKIPNLRAGAKARPEDLIMPGRGYRPPDAPAAANAGGAAQ